MNNAVVTCSNASFATAPPAPNFSLVTSTDNPSSLKASSAVPSLTLIPNSFTASPSLSTLNVPFSAPFISILNISSAPIPN
ncbi:MAG: hypothetical protein NSGCLCUN01_03582 [uncultured Clostridium sp.]